MMVSKVGFIIVSHANPEQALRLTKTISLMYRDPPIVIHHDFSQCPIERDLFPSNVNFVEPSIATGWGRWSVVQSFLAALELLYNKSDPEWFFLLSASDYPIKPSTDVLRELAVAECDAFIDIHQLHNDPSAATVVGEWNPKLLFLKDTFSRNEKRKFYLRAQIWVPVLRLKPKLRVGRHAVYLPFQGKTPFHSQFHLYYGEHWYVANRRCASVLLEPNEDHKRLREHLRLRFGPDECYYQTVLANTAGLTLNRDNKRYVEWQGRGAHPKSLTSSDLPAAFASGGYFARKFSPNAAVLDQIDAAVLPRTPA